MESNLDLIYAREFLLDYLRIRMNEEVFHFNIVNQIKDRVKHIIAQAQSQISTQENSSGTGSNCKWKVDESFDIEYQTGNFVESKAVLFRIHIRLMKLPNKYISGIINQVIDCIETFLSPCDNDEDWLPLIQGRMVHMQWDEATKPLPLLVLEQSDDLIDSSEDFSDEEIVPKL